MSFRSLLSRHLPAPQYMTLPSVGVDISDTSLKYIQLVPSQHRNSGLRLAAWGDLDIPSGTLSRGSIIEANNLSQVLKELKTKIDTPYVRVSLPEERAYLFETEIKRGSSFKEIRGLLEFRLEENVPLSPREAFFDYHIIDDKSTTGPLRVSVTAYARETIMGYYEAARSAGLTPLSFEVEAQAIARASLTPQDTGAHLIVDFGKTRTGIGIVYQGSLMYTSTIDIGGKELSSALRRQLGDLPEDALTQIKNTQGLVKMIDDSSAYDALITTMSAIKDEIMLRIQYWDTHMNELPQSDIASIMLCGGSANLKGLPSYLTETVGIPASLTQVWRNAFSVEEEVPPIDFRHSLGYATAIGLALGKHI